MHSIREPFGLTLYDLQAEMFAFPAEVQNPHVLPRSTTQRFGREDYHTIAAGVREYAALAMSGGEQSPWARATLSSNEEAGVALDHRPLCDEQCASAIATLRNLAATLGSLLRRVSGWQPYAHAVTKYSGMSALNPIRIRETRDSGRCEHTRSCRATRQHVALARRLSGRYRGDRRRARVC